MHLNIRKNLLKIKSELLQIKYPSFKETALSTALVLLMLIIVSALVIFFDFSAMEIIKKIFFIN